MQHLARMSTTTIVPHHGFGRLDRPRAQLVAAVVVGWAPIAVLGVIGRLFTGRLEPLVADPSVHVRLLVAVPLLIIADLALAPQSRLTLRRLVDEGFVGDDEGARFDRLVRRAERLRGAAVAEAVMLAGAVAVGVATLLGWLAPTGVVHGTTAAGLGPARVWFGLVGLPLFVFLLARALWRWTVWVVTLLGLARLRLQLALAHPDRRGGIAFVSLPSLAFHAPFLFAMSSVLCAAWATQIVRNGATLRQFRVPFLAFVIVGLLLALAPLLAFTPRLFTAARRGLVEYGALATDYVRSVRQRWMAPSAPAELLGTADLQSLNDLEGTYREAVDKAVPIAFGMRELATLLLVMVLPTLPLMLAFAPLDVLGKLARLLLGGR